MASDDGPVLIGGVLRLGLGLAKLSVSAAGFFFRAWLAVMRAVWRQAHFAVGAALAVVAGTGLALLLDWSVPFAVTALTVTNGWLFLPTSDLVWMKRRGYVSPAFVRLALVAVASTLGVDEAAETREARREARLAAKLERRETHSKKRLEDAAARKQNRHSPNTNERWTENAMPTDPRPRADELMSSRREEEDDEDDGARARKNDDDDDDDDGNSSSSESETFDEPRYDVFGVRSRSASLRNRKQQTNAFLRKELRKLRAFRFAMTPIRMCLRAILRVNGLARFADETEEDARRRRNGDFVFGDGDRVVFAEGAVRGIGRVRGVGDPHEPLASSAKRGVPKKNIPRRALPDPSTWPHRPVFVRFSPRDGGSQRATAGWATPWGPETGAAGEKTPPSSALANCPVNTETAMAFESELFVGVIVCRFKGIACPANRAATRTKEDFFKKKRCTFQVLVQGKFKERIRADLVLTGGEFHKPFTERPPNYLVSAGCKFFAALTPGLELDLLCDEPFYTATLGGTVTTLSVDAEGDAPDPLSDVRERNGRMGGAFSRRETTTTSSFFANGDSSSGDGSFSARREKTKTNDAGGEEKDENKETRSSPSSPSSPSRSSSDDGVSVARRCRVLGDPNTAKLYEYNTTDVYTFDYFQSVLLFDSYCLDIGIVKLKLDRHVDGQPLGIMAKHADGRYLYNFEIFHECLLPKTEQGVERAGK